MRNTLILIVLTFFCLQNLQAQATQAQSAQTLFARWTSKYDLNAAQQAKAIKIAERKQKHLLEIAPMLESNPQKYYAKLDALQTGAANALKQILETEQQLSIFQKTQTETRKQRGARKAELRAKSTPKAEIEQELILIFNE